MPLLTSNHHHRYHHEKTDDNALQLCTSWTFKCLFYTVFNTISCHVCLILCNWHVIPKQYARRVFITASKYLFTFLLLLTYRKNFFYFTIKSNHLMFSQFLLFFLSFLTRSKSKSSKLLCVSGYFLYMFLPWVDNCIGRCIIYCSAVGGCSSIDTCLIIGRCPDVDRCLSLVAGCQRWWMFI